MRGPGLGAPLPSCRTPCVGSPGRGGRGRWAGFPARGPRSHRAALALGGPLGGGGVRALEERGGSGTKLLCCRGKQGPSPPPRLARAHPPEPQPRAVPRGPGRRAGPAGPTGSGAGRAGAGRCCRPGSRPPGPPGSPRWAGRWAGGSRRTPARLLRGQRLPHPPGPGAAGRGRAGRPPGCPPFLLGPREPRDEQGPAPWSFGHIPACTQPASIRAPCVNMRDRGHSRVVRRCPAGGLLSSQWAGHGVRPILRTQEGQGQLWPEPAVYNLARDGGLPGPGCGGPRAGAGQGPTRGLT